MDAVTSRGYEYAVTPVPLLNATEYGRLGALLLI